MGGSCNSENIDTKLIFSSNESKFEEKVCIGISTGNWKQKLYNHRHSFTDLFLRNQTVLWRYYWSFKESRLTSQIKWKLIKRYSTANSLNGRCNLFCRVKN